MRGSRNCRLIARTVHRGPRRAYAQCSNDSTRARVDFNSRGVYRLLRELRDHLDIIWAALRTLRIGGHSSIASTGSRAVGAEPRSGRDLGRIATLIGSRRCRRFRELVFASDPKDGSMSSLSLGWQYLTIAR